MNQITDTVSLALLAGEPGLDSIGERLRTNLRAIIEAAFEEELADFLGRLRYDRVDGPAKGYHHGHPARSTLSGHFLLKCPAGQRMRKVDGWATPSQPIALMPLDLAA
jgi:hypothetical protein